MFGLGKHGPDGRYGAIVDIGSGSVGVAIVASDPLAVHPEIIWSHREQMVVKSPTTAPEQSVKNITTTLVNAMLTLGSDGIKALTEHEKGGSIKTMQVAISAPWAYTITKSVTYSKTEPFKITKRLVSELIQTAQKQALEVIDENDIVKKLGLEIITRATIDVSANGYHTGSAFGQDAKQLAITHASAITQKRLLDAVKETKDKVLPKATLEKYTFMLMFYCVLQKLNPDTTEICLIDITNEATEIGIIRDGVLRYCTHSQVGSHTLAREIATLCDIPAEEALGYIRGNIALEATLSEKKQKDLAAVVESYQIAITNLFKRTGDQLSIPRPLFIHCEDRTETFFAESIKTAAHGATSTEHGVHLVTSKLLKGSKSTTNDTALLLSAYFFHKMHSCVDFEQV